MSRYAGFGRESAGSDGASEKRGCLRMVGDMTVLSGGGGDGARQGRTALTSGGLTIATIGSGPVGCNRGFYLAADADDTGAQLVNTEQQQEHARGDIDCPQQL